MKSRLLAFGLAVGLVPAAAVDPGEVRYILVNRVDEGKKAAGMVIGALDPAGQQHVTGYGRVRLNGAAQPDGDTVFEIGSVTKVFTSLLLADMVERGEVKLSDPVGKFLPAEVKVPNRNGKEITLLDLSMQVSGLPRLPTNMKPADINNPYVDYDPAKLYEFLSHYTLPRDIGEKYEYSNVGVGLLGHALARRAGVTYEELVARRILKPSGMNSTSATLSAGQNKHLAQGYNAGLEPVSLWDQDVLAGAGALRSTANDMLKFLSANLELTDSPLRAAMRRMRASSRPTGQPDVEIAMGWHIRNGHGKAIVWHNGATAGYWTFAGFDPASKTAVIVLCNTFHNIDDIGLHLLEAGYPLQKAATPRTEIPLDPTTLETYVGRYELTPAFVITITREAAALFLQATGQPRFPVFAESSDRFFLKVVDAQITFTKDGSGKVNALILHQNSRDQTARRLP